MIQFFFVEDIYVKNIIIKNLIKISDNDFRECIVSYELFLKNNDSVLTYEESIENLLLGKIVVVNYIVKDYSMNQTPFELEIVPIDTTPPTIYCSVEDNKLYKELNQIETTVSDNFLYEVSTTIYLDGAIYQNEIITEGKHSLQIIAVDKANNKSIYECNFVVSTKGAINNIINGNLKINNVILISVIVGITLFVCAIEIIYYKVKKKNKN